MFARTERLLLRPGWMEDAPVLAQAIGDEAIVRNLARAPCSYRLEDAEKFLSLQFPVSEPNLLILRRTHGAPQLVGSIGLGRTSEGEAELGYWIARPYWGLGYATEAARAVVDVARHSLKLERIVAGHFLDNPASARVLRKVGFRPTGAVEQRYSAGRGVEVPCRLFELQLSEADAAPEAEGDAPNCCMLAA